MPRMTMSILTITRYCKLPSQSLQLTRSVSGLFLHLTLAAVRVTLHLGLSAVHVTLAMLKKHALCYAAH